MMINAMQTLWWWCKITVIGLLSVTLLTVSLFNLASAYGLKNPLEFVMTFFSQSLLLMVGAVGILHVAWQIFAWIKRRK